jgi:hypothetical protein
MYIFLAIKKHVNDLLDVYFITIIFLLPSLILKNKLSK